MRVLVTGGSGFIGTNLVQMLLDEDAQVLNLDFSEPKNPAHEECWKKVDILDKEALQEAWEIFDPTHVYHLAATTDLDGKKLGYYTANIEGVRNIACLVSNSEKLIRCMFASSRLVCDISYQPQNDMDYHPTTVYGQSKVLGEKIVRETLEGSGKWVIVRPTSIWGPWFGEPYRTFFETISKGLYVHPGTKNILKSYGYVKNTIFEMDKLMHACEERVRGKTFYLMDYPPLNLADWATLIQEGFSARPISTVPLPLLQLLGRFGDAIRKAGVQKFPLTTFRVNNLATNMVYEDRELEDICGELPYTLSRAVTSTLEWMNDRN